MALPPELAYLEPAQGAAPVKVGPKQPMKRKGYYSMMSDYDAGPSMPPTAPTSSLAPWEISKEDARRMIASGEISSASDPRLSTWGSLRFQLEQQQAAAQAPANKESARSMGTAFNPNYNQYMAPYNPLTPGREQELLGQQRYGMVTGLGQQMGILDDTMERRFGPRADFFRKFGVRTTPEGTGGGLFGQDATESGLGLYNQMLGAMGSSPMLSDQPQYAGIRDLIYGKAKGILSDQGTGFMDTPYGRLLSAQAAESTNAGIRDYLARTGGANTAAAAATASLLRSQGATNLARAGLQAKMQQQQELGGYMDFIAQGRGLEAGMLSQERGLQAGLMGQAFNITEQRRRDKMSAFQSLLGAL